MPNYTVQDTTTGKKITFEWNDPNPPTDTDMEEIFSQAKVGSQQQPQTQPAGESFFSKYIDKPLQAGIPLYGLAKNPRMPSVFAGGFNVGAGNVAGMPVDIINKALSLAGLGTEEPFLGSKYIQKNIMPTPTKPSGPAETIVSNIGEQVPYAMSGALIPGGMALKEATKFAIGAGTGAGLAESIAPESPYVKMAGELMGGVGVPAIKTGIGALTKTSSVGQAIQKGMTKGVRPSVIGKGTASEAQRYFDQSKIAVNTIFENKSNLKFTDETGRVIVSQGELPKTLKQFGEAVEQTRKSVYQEYNALSRQAGQQPHKIDLTKIADELDVVATDPTVLREAPGTARYAAQRAKAYRNNAYSPEEAEQAIAINNRKLHTMPTSTDANNRWVDKVVNDNLRRELDNLIENSVGPGYQQLKNKYSALKTVEQDVIHRSWIDARKPEAGFFDVTNVFTGFEAIRGITTGNLPMIVAAAGSKGIASWMKWLNNPNRIVKNMFSNVERLSKPQPLTPLGKVALPATMDIYTGMEGS